MDEVEQNAPKFAKKHCKTLGFEPAAYTLNGPFCALPLAAERIGPFLCTSRGRSGLKEGGGRLPVAATFHYGKWKRNENEHSQNQK